MVPSLARITTWLCPLLALGATACVTAAIDATENTIKLPERQETALADGEDAPNAPAETRAPDTTVTPDGADDEDAGPSAGDASPPPPVARWLQANEQDCVAFCAARGATNVASPEGARCTSGENIPASALSAKITYDKCFPNCSAHLAGSNARSSGGECYADGQKQDGDDSDRTRGCFCQ